MLEAKDGSDILCVSSVMTPDSRTFEIPFELKVAGKHSELSSTNVFKRVQSTLKKRGQYRNIWIPLTGQLRTAYLDEGENLHFRDHYLEETTVGEKPTLNETLTEVVSTQKKDENLKKISEKFVLDKFSNKIANANQWLQEFENECERFDIERDEKKIEIFKYMLEKPVLDWYSSMVIKFSINSQWSTWKLNFCETYGSRGWSTIKYAFNFKYQAGSMLEYATKKERLILEVNKTIDDLAMINLIAIGLPEEILNKIDRESLKNTTQLFTEINKYEYMKKKRFGQNQENKIRI